MSKRELGQLSGANQVEGPRTKRRREMAGASSDVDVVQSDPVISGHDDSGQGDDAKKELVQEQGFKLWQTVKDAVNKEGRALSLDFLRRPSRRQYPDYYQLIQRPIALEEIKKQLESGSYSTLEAVRQDFELCFNNAKQYNLKDSDIWKDAKDLLKLVNKTYNKMIPTNEDGENAEGDGEKKSKGKSPNLTRLVKSRLQKLVDKADDSGRVLSTMFMELPSKKEWPLYYKEIKRPQCLENIFKRIKRKEYYSSGEFAADVELVFANAMAFNQEHTGIWEDARTLRDYFRLLMADMPAPYALAEYTKSSNGKIKIKVPQAVQPFSSSSVPPAQSSVSSSLLLRVPTVNQTKTSPTSTPIPTDVSLPAVVETPPSAPPSTPSTQITQAPSSSTQPIPYANSTFPHYPNASYIPPVTASTSSSTPKLSSPTTLQAHSASNSPAPSPLHPSHQLKSISLKMQPGGRSLNLDSRDGVKCWAMRLVSAETEVHVFQVAFLGDGEEESSGEEEDEEVDSKYEEEEEETELDTPAKNGRRKGKGKGRGRPKGTTKAAIAKAKAVTAKKKKQKVGPIQLKMNGSLMKEQEDEVGKWVVHPSIGMNVLEIGESGGQVWKVYIQRMDVC